MDLPQILQLQRRFVQAREWDQFHTPKNLAMALSVEAAELLEIFQWLTTEEATNLTAERRQKVEHELADVFFFLLRLSDVLEMDLEKAFRAKMKHNARKYPVRLSRGSAKKYTELRSVPTRKKRKS